MDHELTFPHLQLWHPCSSARIFSLSSLHLKSDLPPWGGGAPQNPTLGSVSSEALRIPWWLNTSPIPLGNIYRLKEEGLEARSPQSFSVLWGPLTGHPLYLLQSPLSPPCTPLKPQNFAVHLVLQSKDQVPWEGDPPHLQDQTVNSVLKQPHGWTEGRKGYTGLVSHQGHPV